MAVLGRTGFVATNEYRTMRKRVIEIGVRRLSIKRRERLPRSMARRAERTRRMVNGTHTKTLHKPHAAQRLAFSRDPGGEKQDRWHKLSLKSA